LCCVAVVGLWRPASGQGYTPPDIDFDKVEIWPLSGGVRDGVKVQLTAKGITPGDPATIAFLTANYEVAFSMEFDSSAKMIKRNSYMGNALGEEVTRGGWPWAADGAMTVDFLRTPDTWDITIDGTRMPWFDFAHRTAESVVYAAVHATLQDGEVVDTRSDCAVECHPDECEAGCVSADKCVSRKQDNTCSNATETDDGMSCCDGYQAMTVTGPPQVGNWVKVFSDTDFVASACTAFGGVGSACTTAAGNKVRIEAVKEEGVFSVWVPQLYAVGDTDIIDIPMDVLAPSVQQSRTVQASGDIRKGLTLVGERALITEATGDAATEGYAKWWFINMLYMPTVGPQQLPAWVSYNKALYGNHGECTQMWIIDENVGHTTCSDDATWMDKFNNTCAAYSAGKWCEDHGVATEAFKTATKWSVLSAGASAPGGWYATWTCCLCGGGFHAAPPSATSLLFQ